MMKTLDTQNVSLTIDLSEDEDLDPTVTETTRRIKSWGRNRSLNWPNFVTTRRSLQKQDIWWTTWDWL